MFKILCWLQKLFYVEMKEPFNRKHFKELVMQWLLYQFVCCIHLLYNYNTVKNCSIIDVLRKVRICCFLVDPVSLDFFLYSKSSFIKKIYDIIFLLDYKLFELNLVAFY